MSGGAMTVTVLRGSCGEGDTCPKIADTGHPEFLHVVGEPETDPAVLAAMASHLGSGEVVYRLPRSLLPEVTR